MADYRVTDTQLSSIANAIRTKGGTSASLEFPTDFISAIDDIQTGGSIYLSAIAVTTQPSKTQYDVGDTLDLTGIVITATYSNGATKYVTSGCTFSPDDGDTLSTSGTQTITINYSEDGHSATSTATVTVAPALEIVSFSTGTDAQIAAMIDAAHNGDIDLQTDGGWSVGDTRTINISAFTASGVSFPQQAIDIVITSFDDYNSCGNVLQFDFLNSLNSKAKMYNDNDNTYSLSYTHTSYLPSLVNALPSWLSDALRTFDVLVSAGKQSSDIVTLSTKLALRSEIELFGSAESGFSGEGTHISYYDSNNRRMKKLGNNGSYNSYWTRSPYKSDSWSYVKVYHNGNRGTESASISSSCAIAPFGCL